MGAALLGFLDGRDFKSRRVPPSVPPGSCGAHDWQRLTEEPVWPPVSNRTRDHPPLQDLPHDEVPNLFITEKTRPTGVCGFETCWITTAGSWLCANAST